MADQIAWDDVSEGLELGPVVRHPTSQQLVKYAGASGDYYQIHYDKDFAQGTGLEDIILHGALKNAFLGSLGHRLDGAAGQPAAAVLPVPGDGHSRASHHRPRRGHQQVRGRRRILGRLRDLAGERAGSAHHTGAGHRFPPQEIGRAVRQSRQGGSPGVSAEQDRQLRGDSGFPLSGERPAQDIHIPGPYSGSIFRGRSNIG